MAKRHDVIDRIPSNPEVPMPSGIWIVPYLTDVNVMRSHISRKNLVYYIDHHMGGGGISSGGGGGISSLGGGGGTYPGGGGTPMGCIPGGGGTKPGANPGPPPIHWFPHCGCGGAWGRGSTPCACGACCGPVENMACGRIVSPAWSARCCASNRSAGVPCRSPCPSFFKA